MTASFRRGVAILVLGSGILALVFRARPDAPVCTSLSLLRKFWSSNDRTRRLNSPTLRDDLAFGQALVDADAAWPLARDVRLCLSPELSPVDVERFRRTAAFVLAPRFVRVEKACAGAARFRLIPIPAPGEPRGGS